MEKQCCFYCAGHRHHSRRDEMMEFLCYVNAGGHKLPLYTSKIRLGYCVLAWHNHGVQIHKEQYFFSLFTEACRVVAVAIGGVGWFDHVNFGIYADGPIPENGVYDGHTHANLCAKRETDPDWGKPFVVPQLTDEPNASAEEFKAFREKFWEELRCFICAQTPEEAFPGSGSS